MNGVDISLSFNLEQIYDNCNFVLNDKDKVGIIGVNGAGKTTLFNVLLGKIKLDSGRINMNNKNIGYLPQEIVIEDEYINVYNYIESARPIKKLEKELSVLYEQISSNVEDEKIFDKIAKKQAQLEFYNYYNYENEIMSLFDMMDISIELIDMKLKDLSGGQKSKIAFLRLLYSKKDILLLDEPTNHLDKSSRDFIIDYLKKYKGMVLIISHDIDFLNKIVKKIMYIDKANKKIIVYDGNYEEFMKKFNHEKELREKLIDKEEKEISELKKFIDKANKASQTNHNLKRMGKDRQKKLGKKLENKINREVVNSNIKLNIKLDNEGARIPLTVNNLYFGYEKNKELYNNLSFIINRNERFLIVGENGVGKSTLLKLLINKLKPISGKINFASQTSIAYYAQELELLDLNKTILDNVETSEYSDKELRNFLACFLFFGDDVYKKVNVLSPGEKARVALCKIVLSRSNLLLLDEPTNHLDPETQRIIGENFKHYSGTIIMVSHNVDFVESIGIDRMLILPSGKIKNYSTEELERFLKLRS